MAAPQILVHVGFHKTATTWLQKVYFPKHDGIAFPFKRPELSKALVRPHPFVFDAAATRAQLMERIEPALDEGKSVVLSNERFTGNPASGGIDALEIADRLAQTLPEARIWMSFREQRDIITSYYNQFVKQGGTCTPEQFLAGNPTHKRIPHFSRDYFHYLPLLRRFEEGFGAENVLATPFEAFKEDRDEVLRRVGDFAGFRHDPGIGRGAGRVNGSLSDRSIRMLRVLNGLFPHQAAHKHFRPLVRLPGSRQLVGLMHRLDRILGPGKRNIKPRIASAVGSYYARSNRALADHLNMDLSRWGYPMVAPMVVQGRPLRPPRKERSLRPLSR